MQEITIEDIQQYDHSKTVYLLLFVLLPIYKIIEIRLVNERQVEERQTLQQLLLGGNVSRTAAFIGMERSALHRKLKALGVETNLGQKEPQS